MAVPENPEVIRRLDHVAIAVTDTEQALRWFRDRLGLEVVHTEENVPARARLTYLDAGNAFIQLVEPLSPDASVAAYIAEYGEGVHHICFGVDDVGSAVAELSGSDELPPLGSGRGLCTAFLPEAIHGVRVEIASEPPVDSGPRPPA